MKTPGAHKGHQSGHILPDAHASFTESFRDEIRSRVRPIPKLVRAIIKDHDIDAVHDLRAGIAKIARRDALGAASNSRPQNQTDRAELKCLTRMLGTSREIDVDIQILEELRSTAAADEQMAAEHLLERLGKRRRRAYARLVSGLRKRKPTKLRQEVLEMTQQLPDAGIIDDARDANDALDPLIESAFASLPALNQSVQPQELHRMRIAVKRLRYAMEWLSPAAPGGFTGSIHRLVSLQDCLGGYHDYVQLDEVLSEIEQDLLSRGRESLAAGVRKCRDRIASKHRELLVQFLELISKITASTIHEKTRAALGQGSVRPQVAIRIHKAGG